MNDLFSNTHPHNLENNVAAFATNNVFLRYRIPAFWRVHPVRCQIFHFWMHEQTIEIYHCKDNLFVYRVSNSIRIPISDAFHVYLKVIEIGEGNRPTTKQKWRLLRQKVKNPTEGRGEQERETWLDDFLTDWCKSESRKKKERMRRERCTQEMSVFSENVHHSHHDEEKWSMGTTSHFFIMLLWFFYFRENIDHPYKIIIKRCVASQKWDPKWRSGTERSTKMEQDSEGGVSCIVPTYEMYLRNL